MDATRPSDTGATTRGERAGLRRAPGAHLAIRAPNWVGDLVMSTPVLDAAALDTNWPRVSILVRRPLVGLLEDSPWRASVYPVDSSRAEPGLYRELAPDLVLLLSNSLGSAWRALRGGVPERVGSALSGRRWLLDRPLPVPSRGGRRIPVPSAHLMRALARSIGLPVDELHPRLWVREELVRRRSLELEEAGLAPGEPYVLCAPGAAFGAAKLWPPEHFAEALDRLHAERGWRAVVTGGPGEEALVREVAWRCRHAAVSLADARRDLERLKAEVRGARLLLVGDSGPRWVAAAFDVPCVSVMGPNFPELTASSLERCRVVRVEGLECAPCLERRCPLGHHRCMRDLPAQAVVATALELLEETGS